MKNYIKPPAPGLAPFDTIMKRETTNAASGSGISVSPKVGWFTLSIETECHLIGKVFNIHDVKRHRNRKSTRPSESHDQVGAES